MPSSCGCAHPLDPANLCNRPAEQLLVDTIQRALALVGWRIIGKILGISAIRMVRWNFIAYHERRAVFGMPRTSTRPRTCRALPADSGNDSRMGGYQSL